jgi:hypothetical protein
VSFSATPLTTRVMFALIATPTAPSSLVMLFLTKHPFPLPRILPQPLPRHLISWGIALTR